MNRVAEILAFLRTGEDAVSGDYIASRLAISRTAVWKYIKQLERLGYVIERAKGRGYRLSVIRRATARDTEEREKAARGIQESLAKA